MYFRFVDDVIFSQEESKALCFVRFARWRHPGEVADYDCRVYFMRIIIWFEARLQPNIGFTLRLVLAVFTRSAINPPKVNLFG